MHIRPNVKRLLFIIAVSLALLFFFYPHRVYRLEPPPLSDNTAGTKIPSRDTNFAQDLDTYDSPGLSEAVIPMELKERIENQLQNSAGNYSLGYKSLQSGEEVVINPGPMTAASIIKIFVMLEAYHQVYNNKITLDETLILMKNDKVGGTGSLGNSQDGKEITIRQLIKIMITESDNTATNMLIDKLSFEKINEFITAQGCLNTVLQRKMMDQASIQKGVENKTSVMDLVLVLEKLYHGQCVSPVYDQEMIDIMRMQKDRSRIPRLLPPDVPVAHKTGDLSGIVNDAGIIYTGKDDFILCILSRDVTNPADAKETIAKVSRIIFDAHNKVPE